jgi:hypothetical protein
MRLSDCHIFENATERCEGILDSFVEGAEMDPVPQLLEEGNENKVVDDTDVSEDKDVEMFRSVESSVPASSKKGTTTNGTPIKTYESCNGEGLASTSTSNTTTSNINHDGFDTTTNNTTDKNGEVKTEQFQISHTPLDQMYVDLSLEPGSSVSLSVGPETDSSVALSVQPETDSESISIKTPICSDSSSSSDSSDSSSSSSDSDSDSSSVPSMVDSDILILWILQALQNLWYRKKQNDSIASSPINYYSFIYFIQLETNEYIIILL